MIKKLKNTITTIFRTNNLTSILALLLLTIALIGLSTAIICIYVSRPIGDDFGAINVYRPDVWLTHTLGSLQDTGRYGQSVLSSIAYGTLGSKISNILPLITGVWLVALIYSYIKSFLYKVIKLNDSHNFVTIIFTILVTFLVIFINKGPQIGIAPTWLTYQALFWPAGIITYTTPLLIFLTTVYLLFIRNNKLKISSKYIIFAIILFFTGLVNEIQPVTIFSIAASLLILSFIKPFKAISKQRIVYIIAMISSFIPVVVLLMSKGSQNRQSATGLSTRGDILPSILHNFDMAIKTIMFRPKDLVLIAAVCLLATLIVKYQTDHSRVNIKKISSYGVLIGTIVIIAAIGSLICSLTLLSIGYGKTVYILPRTLLIPQMLYVFGFIILGSSVCTIIINKIKPYVVTVTLTLAILLFTALIPSYMYKIVTQLQSSISYSNAWTQQETYIKNQLKKDKNATIYLPQSVSGIGESFSLSCVEEGTWLNKQIAEYYNVKRVCSTLDAHLK